MTRPVYRKSCQQVMEEKCTVSLEQVWEDTCTDVSSVAYDEVCEAVTSDTCVTTQQWICEDQDGYGAPKVSPERKIVIM